MNQFDDDYNRLMDKAKETYVFQSARDIVYWDMQTQLPPKGVQLRSQQLAFLQKIKYTLLSDPENRELTQRILDSPQYENMDALKKRNISLYKREYDEATFLPADLSVKIAEQQPITLNSWKRARAEKDFSMYRDELEKFFNLKHEAAELIRGSKGLPTAYDAQIDLWEPGVRVETVSKLFTEMKDGLVKILIKCLDSPNQPDTSFISRHVPVETQRRISEALAETTLYDTKSNKRGGRIDETTHPYTMGYYDDVRVTTRYDESNFCSNIYTMLHEIGHALYEQNLRQEWMFKPLGDVASGGFHECQAKYVENIVGRTPEFWDYFYPKLQSLLGEKIRDIPQKQFVHASNRVNPSKIRLEADEVTYGLHIIIRFEIERALFAGRITVDDTPELWVKKYKDYLGVDIEHDAEGVLQDTHWSIGLFGYFQSYALGNLYCGMLQEKMTKDLPDWKKTLSSNGFAHVKQWMVENVHSYGRMYDPLDLIKAVTGKELSVKPFIRYLDEKYQNLYEY